ncbi:MAG TPA: M23 family metallopeptidase [bacterium]|nr:M23 family metallopeptidase [bacterium]
MRRSLSVLITITVVLVPAVAGAPVLEVSDSAIRQGEALAVTVRGAPIGVAVQFAGRTWPLYRTGGVHRTYVGADARTIPGTYRLRVVEGSRVLAQRTVTVARVAFRQRRLRLDPDKEALFDPALVAEEQRKVSRALRVLAAEQLWEGAFLVPTVAAPISSPYGVQSVYNGTVRGFHRGTDFAAPEGTSVRAANHGIVRLAEPLPLVGNAVFVDHGLGVLTAYFHMSALSVQVGQRVRKGDVVGAVGSTGVATGVHLHWGLRVNGIYVDPMPWTRDGAP